MEKFVKSRWAHIYKKGGIFALFNSNNLETFFVDQEVKRLLLFFTRPHAIVEAFAFLKNVGVNADTQKAKKTLNTLIQTGFLIPSSKNELAELKAWVKNEARKRKTEMGHNLHLNALRVILTEKCNLNCSYCFVRNKKTSPPKDMSWRVLKKGIELLVKLNNKGSIEIQFFGGEPLLQFDLIVEAVHYIQDLIRRGKIKAAYFGITTNGTLVSEEIAQFLKQNNFLVSVSLDGWRSLHDFNRRHLDGQGSFDGVIRGLKILRKSANDIGILITPTRKSIKLLARACEYLIIELKCKFITINTPQPVGGNWEVNGKLFSRELKKCFEIAEKHQAVINNFGTRVIFALNDKKPLIFACSKFGNNYTATLTPDGKLSPCIVSWQHVSSLVSINKFSYQGKFADWKLSPPYFFKRCLNCPAMNICGGLCPLEIYEMKKSSESIEHERCRFFKEFLEWAIWLEG